MKQTLKTVLSMTLIAALLLVMLPAFSVETLADETHNPFAAMTE